MIWQKGQGGSGEVMGRSVEVRGREGCGVRG